MTHYPGTDYPGTRNYYNVYNVWPQWVEQGTAGVQITSGAVNVSDNYYSQQQNIWPQWVNQTYTPAITIQSTANNVWYDWQNQPMFPGASQQVWDAWQIQGAFDARHLASSAPPEPTAAQLAQRQREAFVRRTRGRSFDLRRRLAARRAEKLLLENLNAVQQDEWKSGRFFTVHTADGLRSYRIDYGLAGNVRMVKCEGTPLLSKHGRPVRLGSRFCMHVYHPDGPVPNEDNVLAQKLLLEADEGEFLRLANVS